MTVSIPYVPSRSNVKITVVVDENESIVELCESNNQATRQFAFDLNEIHAPRNRVGEIGGDLTGEIEKGTALSTQLQAILSQIEDLHEKWLESSEKLSQEN